MKRIALSVALVLANLACSSSSPLDTTETLAPLALAEGGDAGPALEPSAEVLDDLYDDVLPTGVFPDVAALCAKEATPCHELPDALHDAHVTLGGAFLEAKVISISTDASTDAFLVIRTKDGWSAVRSALVTQSNDDPGCGSIERTTGITEVRADGDALVVLTTADRSWYRNDEGGELLLTHARACRLHSAGASCGATEVVAAKRMLLTEDLEAPQKEKAVFTTGFVVGVDGAIEPTTRFDEDRFF